MADRIDIDICWGGYYVSREAEHFSLFRLLDFNQHAYHAALFKEQFPTIPRLDDVLPLRPFIGHAPIAVEGLLHGSITLVGAAPLTADDLDGYLFYLEHHDVPADEQSLLSQRLIEFSHSPPMRLSIERQNNGIVITERE